MVISVLESGRSWVGSVMVINVLASNVVDRGFIGGVMVRMLARSA